MFFERLTRIFYHSPDRIAIRDGGRVLTFDAWVERARRYARGLRALGLRPGDTVAVMASSSIDLHVALLGHYLAGLVHAPINTRYAADEVEHILTDSQAKLVLVDAAHAAVVVEAAPGLQRLDLEPGFEDTLGEEPFDHVPADEDIALLIYTSGTTGKSKGVELSFRALVSNIEALTSLWQWSADDRLVLALPLFHVHGLCIGVHGALLHGLEVDLFDHFRPEDVVAAMQAGASVFMGVPTMYARLLEYLDRHPDAAEPLSRARLFTSGSAALSVDHFRRFQAATGHAILERYGMTETLLTLSNPYQGERRPGTVGMPVPGCEVRILDDEGADCAPNHPGQLVVRGSSLMTGYRGQPEQTAASFKQGWFLTGDIAEISEDGYVRIVGRASTDIIKSGGFKISAREIEDVLGAHPRVREIAVLGLPDEVWGERIVAAVVAPGADPDDLLAELQTLGREHLAAFKQVRGLVVLDELPRNAMGKVQKHVLKTLNFPAA